MGQRRNWKLLLLEGGASRGLEKPLARHRLVPHQKAERLGLTYEEYTLEILERGRHLQIEDVERIAEIKRGAPPCNRSKLNLARHCSLMPDIEIRALSSSPDICAMLSEMLIETVANGGSVSFMHPLSLEAADAFWRNSLASADRGERIVLGAFDGEDLIGTVTLVAQPSRRTSRIAPRSRR